MEADQIERIVEATLLAADEPVSLDRLIKLFAPGELPDENPRGAIRVALDAIGDATANRGFELVRVASGFRFQVRQQFSPWVSRLFEERPPRYSRALFETLALIVYRQPVTRGDIEQIRGVSVSQSIMRTLLERGWVRVVGERETPGRPALYGTTRTFLDYFNLKSLDDLPPMGEIESLMKPALDHATLTQETGDEESPDQEKAEAPRPRPVAEIIQLPRPADRPDR
ncbi:MAG: SMC-Scp complex subunit ScpB [Gammaproteobacteria bacterium]|nr:SMC-Scp complex subunit ScpB [Gammaproteobacteria bacterium]MYF31335.1 SMC-Scp complex subunit ScpB [Gammaproteobacteria bacterium]MYK45774.1 SMC-Scp complex subunit ScpB [Gammaproteobacteria bacterium]